jgi:hypothetical protein
MTTINDQLEAYRKKVWQPGMSKAELNQLLATEERRLIDNDPGIKKMLAAMDADSRQRHIEQRERQAQTDQARVAFEQSRDKRAARQAFTEAGGSADEFEKEWPTIRRERAITSAGARIAQRRAAERARIRRMF